jgi:hypothetical protein
MMQILALNCLLNAYSMSVLAIDDVKFSDTQVQETEEDLRPKLRNEQQPRSR